MTSEEVLSIENDSEVNSKSDLLGDRFWLVATGTLKWTPDLGPIG
jgi:hypothetical protein